jgi:hypothetical protein
VARGRVIISGLLAMTIVAGCGYSRAPAPPLRNPTPPQGFHTLSFPADGLTLQAPQGWTRIDEQGSLITTLSSGDAVVAVWRYARDLPLPRGRAEMRAATQALISAVQSRQAGVRVVRARIVHLSGVRGIELNAVERIRGQLRRVRSTHLYSGRMEIVLEEYAPLGVFHSVDHSVFSPLRRSLRITASS